MIEDFIGSKHLFRCKRERLEDTLKLYFQRRIAVMKPYADYTLIEIKRNLKFATDLLFFQFFKQTYC